MTVKEDSKKISLNAKHYFFIAIVVILMAIMLFLRSNSEPTQVIKNNTSNEPQRSPTFQAKIDRLKNNRTLFGSNIPNTNNVGSTQGDSTHFKPESEQSGRNVAKILEGLMNKDEKPQLKKEFNYSDFMKEQERFLYQSLVDSEYQVVNNDVNVNKRSLNTGSNTSPSYVLPMGSIVKVVARSENSNHYLGSPFFGFVAHDVYDFTNQKLLINKGAAAIGRIDAVVSDNPMMETKLGIVIEKIKRSDGHVISFELPASDSNGLGAVTGDVDRHSFKKWGGFSAFALLSSGLSLSTGNDLEAQSSRDNATDRMKQQFSSSASTAANQFLAIKPTVTINTGDTFNVMIKDDVNINPMGDIL